MASGLEPFWLHRSKSTSTSETVVQKVKVRSAVSGSSGGGVVGDYHSMFNGATDSNSNDYAATSSFTHVTTNGGHSAQSTDSDSDSAPRTSSRKRVTFQENGANLDTTQDDECASFKDKIRYLEEEKRILQERWSMLEITDDTSDSSHTNLDALYKSYIDRLLKQLNTVYEENGDSQSKLVDMVGSVHDLKDKFEDEISTHTQLEYDFVQAKKDLDTCSLEKSELEARKKEALETMELMRAVYKHELEELMNEVEDISVTVEMDSGCPVNLEHIVQEVRDQYELLAIKSKEEAEAVSRRKLEDQAAKARKCGSDLLCGRSAIADLNVNIQKMRSEILTLQNQSMHLENSMSEVGGDGERAVKDASAKQSEVEVALQKAREDMARQLLEFKELMNVKLSLDMEIATYKKLLEGEESRIHISPATVVSIHSRPSFTSRSSEWAGSTAPQTRHQKKKRSQSMLIRPQYK
ncbi:keratin, type II cytoskeletal 80-like [Lissotriton helveticus]